MFVSRTFAAGCLALLMAAPATGVTLECVSASGPAGGEVVLEVGFTADPGEIVGGTQNDLTFDANVFDAVDPRGGTPNCQINPDIGAGTVPDKRLARTFLGNDPGVIRGIVISQQNQEEIPVGPLYTCTFAIDRSAARQGYSVELIDAVVSDTVGDRLPVTSNPCTITVTDPPTPTVTPTPDGHCENDDDCDPGEICVDNRCVTPTPTPIGFCEDDNDCPPGEVCVDNRCATPLPTATPEGFCTDDNDCPAGNICVDNRCATLTPTPVGFCEDESDCEPGELCIDNRCATPSPTPIGFCENETDCAPGEVCVDNRCTEPTPTSGGGGGCSCSIEPDPPQQAVLNLMLALLPAAWLLLARRRA